MNIVTAFDPPAAISESLLAGHKVNVCPLWVKSGHVQRKRTCPLYTRKRHRMRIFGCPLGAEYVAKLF